MVQPSQIIEAHAQHSLFTNNYNPYFSKQKFKFMLFVAVFEVYKVQVLDIKFWRKEVGKHVPNYVDDIVFCSHTPKMFKLTGFHSFLKPPWKILIP